MAWSWSGAGAGFAGGAMMGAGGGPLGIAAGGLIGGFLGGKSGGGDDEESSDPYLTRYTYDPYAERVANPLSSYLASQIGKGVDKYTGEVATPMDANYTKTYQEFTGIDAGNYFTKYIQQPATDIFKRDFDATVREGYAGNLRGSGRFGAEEDAINRFSQGLATQRGEFVPGMMKDQLAAEKTVWDIYNENNKKLLAQWKYELPQNNPAINQALQFLSGTAGGTGGSVMTTDPDTAGNNGWLNNILNSVVTMYLSKYTGGKPTGGTT